MSRVDVLKIPFERIDLSDERFRTSLRFPRERLRESLKRAGLVQPLLLVERAGRLVLLSGWRRALVLRELGAAEVEACVFPEQDDLAAFRRVFAENASIRDFSVAEKSLVVRRLLEHGEEEKTVILSVLPFFRLPPTKATLEALKTLSGDDPEILGLLQESDLPPAGAVLLAAMTPEARRRVAGILVPLSRNKQSELVEDLADLSVREGRPVEAILDGEEIQAVLADGSLPAIAKSERVRERLNVRKNPRVRAWRESFARSVRGLGLPEGASVRADPGFESETLVLTLSFRSAGEFRAAIKALEEISRRKDIEALFRETGVRPE
jgi:hypothetical protein